MASIIRHPTSNQYHIRFRLGGRSFKRSLDTACVKSAGAALARFNETKEQAFQRLTPAERAGKDPPIKHRFPKGFHRGNELFGQQASRLNEPGYREFISKHGLIIVEGFNDVINLDNLGVPALAVMSNRITEAQVSKIVTWAKHLAKNRVNLMFDGDDAGFAGAKDALWQLALCRPNVQVMSISSTVVTRGASYTQPELASLDEIHSLLLRQN